MLSLVRNAVLLHHCVDLVFYCKFFLLESCLLQLFVIVWIREVGKLAEPLFKILMLMYQLSELLVASQQLVPHWVSS